MNHPEQASSPNDQQQPEEEQARDEIKAGYYRARGIEGSDTMGYAKNGNPQVAIGVELLEIGRHVTTIMAYSGGAIPITIERLKTMGWKGGETLEGIGSQEFTAEIKYEVNPEDGKVHMRCEVKSAFTFKAPMDPNQKRGFLAELSRTAAQMAQAAGQPTHANAPKGYPADWDTAGGPTASGTPKVDL